VFCCGILCLVREGLHLARDGGNGSQDLQGGFYISFWIPHPPKRKKEKRG
jgi:hypothetical protein